MIGLRPLGLALSALMLAGCSDAVGPPDHAGRYVLTSIDGEIMPAVISDVEGWIEEVMSGRIELEPDGTCGVARRWRVISPAGQAVVSEFFVPCTYVVARSTLTLTYGSHPDEHDTALITNGTITVIEHGAAWVYAR